MSSNKPFPSSDLDVFKENSLILDNFVNSQENEYPDRFARKRPTITGIIKEAFNVRTDISNMNETLIGQSRWDVVPKNTSLSLGGDNGALNKQAQALFNRTEMLKTHAREALRRTYQEAGYNLVEGSFEQGGVLVNVNDVLLQERTGKVFSGPAGTVAAGTNPASGGGIGPAAWVDQSGNILRNTINGFFKSGRWDAVKHLTESRMLVSDNAGLFWEWMGSFPKIITTEPSTADSWKCHGLCNGFDLTDSRNWVPTGATPEVTHKNLQLCLDTYKTIHLMALYGGSKALVVDSATSFTGVNRDMCGYTNIYCNRETLGSVLAPEMGGLTDDYNVIADLIVKPGDNRYAAYLKWDSVSFGLSGRVPLPEYNIYAPRCVATVMGSVKTYRASIANIFSRCWYSSIF